MKPLHVLRPYYDKEEIVKQIESTLETGWTGDGGKTVEFEERWSEFTGWKYNSYVNSCTAALHLALLVIRDQNPERNEVIVPDITFVSTAAVVEQSGLNLRLCDVNESLTIDLDSLRENINSKTLAVFYVGIGGNTKGLREVESICKEFGVKLIIDGAHMGGSKMENGESLSAVEANICCYSYQAVKNLGIADSGMISFNDNKYKEDIKKYRWLGISQTTYERTINSNAKKTYKWEYEIDRLGYKYNGNALIAACCLGILNHLAKDNIHRRNIRNWYMEDLKEVTKVKFVKHHNEQYTSGHLAQVMLKGVKNSDERNMIISKLNDNEIYPGVHYRPISKTDYYKKSGSRCINSGIISGKLISLPCHMGITREDVKRVSSELKKYA